MKFEPERVAENAPSTRTMARRHRIAFLNPMSPSVLQQALALYAKEDCTRTFEEDLTAFIHTGRVHITPTCILLAKAVPSTREYHEPWDTWQPHECDAWLIWLAAGELTEFFQYAPYELPWLLWARRDRLRKWPYHLARRHILQGQEQEQEQEQELTVPISSPGLTLRHEVRPRHEDPLLV